MKNFTKKDYNILLPFEAHLTRGYYGKYVYALRKKDFETLCKVYKDLGFERNMDYSCSTCLLELTSTLGRLFFAYRDEKILKKNEEKEQ